MMTRMSSALLREAGQLLYGPRWQTDLSRDLKVSDRTIRRWDAESHPIPDGIGARLDALLKSRSLVLDAVWLEVAASERRKCA
jgi:hypothetical protein